MKVSLKVRSDLTAADGMVHIMLVVSLPGSERATLTTGVKALPADIGPDKMIRARAAGAEEKNMLLSAAIGKANTILVNGKLAGKTFNKASFITEFRSPGGSTNFVAYMKEEADRQLRLKMIEYETWRSHMVAWRRLERFTNGVLPFASITLKWVEEFDHWVGTDTQNDSRTRADGKAARSKAIKALKKYFNRALKDSVFKGLSPFRDFKIRPANKRLIFCTEDEVKRLANYYYTKELQAGAKAALRCYLISCVTGLRVSDIRALRPENLVDGSLVFQMSKNRAKNPKTVVVPLTDDAKILMQEAGWPLMPITEQYCNREMKKVATILKIQKPLTMHTARHTFGTLFIARTGQVAQLQKLLGHSNLNTTMIYVHVGNHHLEDSMKSMEGIF